MELAQDKINFIEKAIKTNKKFVNNEDLYEDFFNETCKRSLPILKTITSDATIETYIKKIATTAIINVLKDSGRLRRTKSGFMSTGEVLVEDLGKKDNLTYSSVEITYSNVNIQETPEDIVIKKEILQKIVDSVCELDKIEPEKLYLKLYSLRYDKGMTQKEISEKLELSQSEVSKRLFKLMVKVKQAFN